MTAWLDDGDVRLFHGDAVDVLRQLPDQSVHMCATSPPFYGLRDYGTGEWEGGDQVDCPDCTPENQRECKTCLGTGEITVGAVRVDRQIGLEETPDQWVARLVDVFREVRRVLRDDGTLWVEIGDSYNTQPAGNTKARSEYGNGSGRFDVHGGAGQDNYFAQRGQKITREGGLKPKDLLGQPWLLAFALRADGWYLRSEIIWARPNPMPESVTDRPTKAHSTVFLLSKKPRYFFDADAIREPLGPDAKIATGAWDGPSGGLHNGRAGVKPDGGVTHPAGANARSVWTIPTEPTPFAHFATWPQALVRRMILAGTSERGCCPECGAPWVRDVERTTVQHQENWSGSGRGNGVVAGGGHEGRTGQWESASTTLGWSPSCTHDADPVPCVVLDPFSGSSTTSLVARNHGRHSIGIELNENYLEIARQRLQQLSLLTGAT